MFKISLFTLVSLLLFSCGKDYGKREMTKKLIDEPVVKPKVPYSELTGKTEDTFLKLKYVKYDLICSLYSQLDGKLKKTDKADDSISIDLINDYKQAKEFILKTETEDRTVEFKFHVREFSIADSEFKLDDGQTISAKMSPQLNIQYRYVTYANEAERLELEKSSNFYNREMLVLERKTNKAVENPSVDEEVFNKPDVINCEVASVLKPEYVEHYKLGK